jgi:hypothetical protein
MEEKLAKPPETFADMIAREKERIDGLRQELLGRISEAQAALAGLDRELEAIDAYVNVKEGKAAPSGSKRASKKSGDRAPRGERQTAILAALKDKPDGLTRGELIKALGAENDKAAQGSISNALVNMKKANKVDNRDGRYVAA